MGTEDELRAEITLLRDLLTSQERENNLLRNLLSDRARDGMIARHGASPPARVQVGSRERMAMLEHTVDILDGCVQGIAQWDCYNDTEEECTCATCRATHALATVKDWRYGGSAETPSRRFEGALHYRTSDGWNPREAKIHRAWVKHMETWQPDHTLGMVLTDRPARDQPRFGLLGGPTDWPTARDWYVATSVVQWLVTNVGSAILEAAGWKYAQWDEDRVSLDEKRAEERAQVPA